jgi:carboxyl-terminal processing protease
MRISRIPSAAVITALSVTVGVLFGTRVASTQDRTTIRYRAYTAALAAIETDYVEPMATLCASPGVCGAEALVYGSIDGMLRTLDPHSSFFSPKEFASMRERQNGYYFGIGISIQRSVAGDVTVTSLFEGSPAYLAGIRRGDVIAKVGAEDAKGWQTEDVVARVKGPKGTTIEVTIRRPGVDALIPITVARDEIKIPSVRTAFMLAPGTGYVRQQDFSETTNTEVGQALTKLKAAGMQRLVLDLRENPGGPLDQAIAVASRFLKRGQMVVYTRGRIRNSDEDYRVRDDGGYTDVPLIVLVNRGSASASEIVSGSMQDHDRGLIIGETTFGKALVQSVYPVANSAGLALTTGRYYTPAGRMIQRPWDGAFDDYLTYRLRDQNPEKAHSPTDLKYTDSGRRVYGGGGIEPDHFMAGPENGFNPTRFAKAIEDRGMFVGFAERFVRAGDDRPGSKAAATAHRVAAGWELTDAVVDEFRAYLVDSRVKIDETAFKTDLTFIKAMIHFEVDTDLFGVEEARKNLTKVDPQAQAALGYFEEAKALLDRPKSASAPTRPSPAAEGASPASR